MISVLNYSQAQADPYPLDQGRVWLIDLNPFGEVTDSLLFSWEELTSGGLTQQQVSDERTRQLAA